MKELKDASIVIITIYVFGCILAIAVSFFITKTDFLIDIYVLQYKFAQGFLFFILFLPALQISSLLVGYSWAFGRSSSHSVGRMAPVFLNYLRNSILLILICLVVTTAGLEIAKPLLKQQQYTMRLNSEDYFEFLDEGEKAFELHNYSEVRDFISRALYIYPKSPEALHLWNLLEEKLAEVEGDAVYETAAADLDIPMEYKVLTPFEALTQAQSAYAAGKYFEAHYYAQLAMNTTDDRDPNRHIAKLLAGEAWNKLSEFSASKEELNDYEIFKLKREGYLALQNADYIRAYYIFMRLEEISGGIDKKVADPDIVRYLELASMQVKKQHFFIDEVETLRSFESVRKVYFSIDRPDRDRDIIAIEGITYSHDMGQAVLYLRDLNVARFTPDGKPLFSFYVPYAKMSAFSLLNAEDSFVSTLYPQDSVSAFPYPSQKAQDDVQKYPGEIPLILLQAVDSRTEGVKTVPQYTFGEPEAVSNLYFLPMPYDDFSLLIENSYGIEAMPLMSLWKFAQKAPSYGFASEIYLEAFIARLLFPFLLLILSVVATMFGWNYRITGKQPFKMSWACFVPVFVVVCYYVIEIIEYIAGLFVFVCIGYAPLFALPAALAIVVIVLMLALTRFLTMRGD